MPPPTTAPDTQSLRKHVYRGDPLVEPPPAELAAILQRHRGERDGLITALEEVQRHYGYLGQDHLRYAARMLGFPLARVFGVATFYNLFRFDPPGKYQVRVCRGTACHVNHSAAILAHLRDQLGIDVDETTADEPLHAADCRLYGRLQPRSRGGRQRDDLRPHDARRGLGDAAGAGRRRGTARGGS